MLTRILIQQTSLSRPRWASNCEKPFPFNEAPRYLRRDRLFVAVFRKKVKDLSIEEVLSAPPRLGWRSRYWYTESRRSGNSFELERKAFRDLHRPSRPAGVPERTKSESEAFEGLGAGEYLADFSPAAITSRVASEK
jgi:hypothetical protein